MNERGLRLLSCLGDIDTDLIDEAEEAPVKKKRHPGRWVALAASLAVVILGASLLLPSLAPGGSAGGSGVNAPEAGPSSFMIYTGPLLPMTLREADPEITAERQVTLDFAPWLESWRGDILVTDRYALTNHSNEDKTVTVLYPFVSNLGRTAEDRPALTLEGQTLETELVTWDYVGGFEGAWGGSFQGDPEGSVNLSPPDNWEDYRDALADGSYLAAALEPDYPDFSDIPAVIYDFTDPWGEPENEKNGIPNPTIRAMFQAAPGVRVLSTGFNGHSVNRDSGKMGVSFSIPREGERSAGPYRIIAAGGDIGTITTQGYVTGGWDTTKTIEAGVTITRRETDLETALSEYFQEHYEGSWTGEDGGPAWDMVYGLFKLWLVTYGPLAESPMERYDMGDLESGDMISYGRVFWAEAQVTLPAGAAVTMTATLTKGDSYDPYCLSTSNKGVSGYDLATRLASNLTFAGQSATLEDRGAIEIVRQNFGFDIENGVKTVALTEEEYYLEVRRAPTPEEP